MAFVDLGDGWAVGVYDHGYMVGKVAVTVDAKTGKDREIIRNPDYFHDLSDCVECAYKNMVREKIGAHRKNITLENAIRDMREVEAKLKEDIGPIRRIEERLSQEAKK